MAQVQSCQHTSGRVRASIVVKVNVVIYEPCVPPCHSLVIGTFPPAAHCTPAIHHPRIWGESSSEHLVAFDDPLLTFLTLLNTGWNFKMGLILIGNQIRNRLKQKTVASALFPNVDL